MIVGASDSMKTKLVKSLGLIVDDTLTSPTLPSNRLLIISIASLLQLERLFQACIIFSLF